MQKNKYKATKAERDNRTFHSKAEAYVYDMLRLMQRAGVLTDIECQVQVGLSAARIIYKPDFRVTKPDGGQYYVECKGFETDAWRIKKKLWRFYGPGALEIWNVRGSKPILIETIVPDQACSQCCGAALK